MQHPMLQMLLTLNETGLYCQQELTNNTGELTLAYLGKHFLNIIPKNDLNPKKAILVLRFKVLPQNQV